MSENKLFDNTVCLMVTFHKAGNNRRFKPGEVEIRKSDESAGSEKADQSQLKASKTIFQSENYADALRISNKFDEWVGKRAHDSPLRRKTYLIPLDLLDEVYVRADGDEKQYNKIADALADEYEAMIDRARDRLKELFREEDYVSRDQFRRAFWVERKLFDFSPPGESKLSESIYKQEKQKWADTFADAEADVLQALREACRSLVAHLADTLTPKADGKKKKFYDSTVDKLVEFFDLFDRRNILNDEELKKLVEHSRRVLRGGEVLTDALRSNESMRDVVREQMEDVKTKLDTLIQSGPRRVISFEEDE